MMTNNDTTMPKIQYQKKLSANIWHTKYIKLINIMDNKYVQDEK